MATTQSKQTPKRHGRLRTRLSLQADPNATWKDRKPIHVGDSYHRLCQQLVESGRFKSMGEAVEAGLQLLVNSQSIQVQEQN